MFFAYIGFDAVSTAATARPIAPMPMVPTVTPPSRRCVRSAYRVAMSQTRYDAIVVGSGYGGGVSALRLGQAGVNTLILEKGRLWDAPDADGRRFTKMLPADTRAGWFTDGDEYRVCRGHQRVAQLSEHARCTRRAHCCRHW